MINFFFYHFRFIALRRSRCFRFWFHKWHVALFSLVRLLGVGVVNARQVLVVFLAEEANRPANFFLSSFVGSFDDEPTAVHLLRVVDAQLVDAVRLAHDEEFLAVLDVQLNAVTRPDELWRWHAAHLHFDN